MRMAAAGTDAPVASVIVPEIVPLPCWAASGNDASSTASGNTSFRDIATFHLNEIKQSRGPAIRTRRQADPLRRKCVRENVLRVPLCRHSEHLVLVPRAVAHKVDLDIEIRCLVCRDVQHLVLEARQQERL